jgi:hypothetical protein
MDAPEDMNTGVSRQINGENLTGRQQVIRLLRSLQSQQSNLLKRHFDLLNLVVDTIQFDTGRS